MSRLPFGECPCAIFAHDGRSFLYAVSSRGELLIYRQLWKDGKVIGTPQVALKLTLTLPSNSVGSYDFPATFPPSCIITLALMPTSIFSVKSKFRMTWNDHADPDIPILKQAKAEYAKLQA